MLQPKTVHYPSGFPMPQTPPVFICSSPGPDPYESSSNLYEELDQHHTDSHSELSQNDRTLPQVDRTSSSDNLNSSADTALATDEMTNSNGVEHETSSTPASVVSCSNRNASEGEVEWRNRINVANNITSSSTAVVATIFRDRNIQQHTARANANYYAPPHNTISSNSHRANSNGHFLLSNNPRAIPSPCWGSHQIHHHPQQHQQFYEPIGSPNFNYYNSSDFATVRSFHSLRSPHHITQNTINSRKNLWSWFRTSKRT